MSLPLVPRSELDATRSEREEWRRRAELAFREATGRAEFSWTRARARWTLGVVASAVLALGIGLGASATPDRPGAGVKPDYSACIGKARYEHPIADNRYQELVNALYSCGVYELSGAEASG